MRNIDALVEKLKENEQDVDELIASDERIRRILERSIDLISRWKIRTSSLSQLKKADTLVAFSFGLGEKNKPGKVNEALAYCTDSLHKKTSLPILSQWEVAEELKKFQITPEYTAYPKKGYSDTKGVAEQFFNFISKRSKDYKKIAVIAHPDHQYRCGEILKKMNFRVFYPRIKDFLPDQNWKHFHCDRLGYWKKSSQPWTTNRAKFIKHEICIRMLGYREGDL